MPSLTSILARAFTPSVAQKRLNRTNGLFLSLPGASLCDEVIPALPIFHPHSPRATIRRMKTLRAIIIFASLSGGIAALITFFKVDRQVGDRLAGRQQGGLAMILSGPTQIHSGTEAAKLIKNRLEAHRYVQVGGSSEPGVPTNTAEKRSSLTASSPAASPGVAAGTSSRPLSPGEFSHSGGTLTVVTRAYRNATSEEVPSRTLKVNTTSGEITSLTDEPLSSITLEPTAIAPLGSAEVRASSFRPLAEIPQHLQDAFLAIEDRRFYRHVGVDPVAIARAIVKNFSAGRLIEGGSTLTQQLAKNILFTPKKTLGRKVMEMFAALSLERRLTKQQILELYLNEIYFSQEGQVAVHGVQEASRSLFGKDVTKISTAEGALLAGMVKAPSSYSPRRNIKQATIRRNLVLDEMRDQGFISEKVHTAATAEKISLGPAPFRKKDASFFVAAIEKHIGESFDIEAAAVSGVQVHTWLDPDLQRCAEQAVSESITALEKGNPKLRKKQHGRSFEQSLVAIEPYSGAVRAWVGGRDFSANQFDHIAMARRQIGSTIKPFLYLTALDGSLNSYRVATPISILSDEPTGITLFDKSQWTPKNYDRKFRGDVTLRYALERSLNIPAVYVAQRVGIPALAHTLRQFAVSPEVPEFPALALGALDTTLLNLTAAYGALANGGRLVAPRIFNVVLSPEGEELSATTHNETVVAQEGPVYLVTDILRGVIERGTAQVIRRMGYKGVVAGKTGTSNDTRDAWFVGFTPRLAVGVWTGYDDNSPLGLTGGAASAPTWARFMQCAESLVDKEDFIRPPSVEAVPLDREFLCRASGDYPKDRVVTELFVRGTEPTEDCSEASYQGEAAQEESQPERDELSEGTSSSQGEGEVSTSEGQVRNTEEGDRGPKTGRRPSFPTDGDASPEIGWDDEQPRGDRSQRPAPSSPPSSMRDDGLESHESFTDEGLPDDPDTWYSERLGNEDQPESELRPSQPIDDPNDDGKELEWYDDQMPYR